ncbi:hypothetical protein CO058_02670 [candidate division WWE3 bacterium CG_4_9_14_0_2_um_filter_35_11]|uniref:Glycosyltransferase 2-like domain-containing protein n=1 Tax=candidate division WWE3 bacterium CG_4_9_14_0_2_um_filter_35_11 TaxID=1975077 RepID=A0A2M8ELN2_UNCKA|nr:MAG: hypothetical protein COV25_02930 [candidate division WWE3 bacterium CG10_big_fil_rev_8_21_14_0_10_35_32]PJC23638.1 MAG: hypothetical protein CO058_02670 [candidate division WWE3 bacterium CG_4_9_14_0_2_um_filter_35_11]
MDTKEKSNNEAPAEIVTSNVKDIARLIKRRSENGIVSIVIPCYNESGNIGKTIDGLLDQEKKSDYKFEIIPVDDGSKDDTWNIIESYSKKHSQVIGIQQLGNFGQSQAYQAGFDIATGDYVLICSADLETPLENINRIIDYLDSGYDFVNTNRVGRWGGDRAVKSGYANRIIKKISGMDIQDRGSGMKGMIAPLAQNLKFYGDMHRFIPDYVSVYGARIVEFSTKFQDREFGVSAYKGHKRTVKVLLDLTTLLFMLYFAKKPHTMMPGRLFGFTGAIMAVSGGFISFILILGKLVFGSALSDRPLFTTGILMVVLGVIMAMFGMLGELLMRIYFESSGRKPYMVRQISRKSES